MSNRTSFVMNCQRVFVALLATFLAACDPAPQADDSANQADQPVPSNEAPDNSTSAPAEVPPPDQAPTAPAQPAPSAPSPVEPSPVPDPVAAANEPALEAMKSARPPSKLGVPVDLRYSFESDPLPNQPAILHLAAVPRVTGTNLGVSIKTVTGIQVAAAGPLAVSKANANGAYRQHFAITRQASAPAELRVLVTMDMPEGTGFGFYSIPLNGGTKSQKLDSVKQH